MKRIILVSLTIIISCLVFFSFIKQVAQAAEFQGVSVYPKSYDPETPMSSSWFIYNLLPGETKKDAIIVRNDEDKTIDLKIYAVDGTTTSDGAFALNGEDDKKTGIGSWTTIEKNILKIAAKETVEIPFTIYVPEDSVVGDHLGGIVIENIELSKFKGINIKTRVGVRIYQTVPGDIIKKLELTKVIWKKIKTNFFQDKVFLDFYLKNNGNVRLEPKAKISVNQNSEDFDLRMVLPNKPVVVPFQIKKLPLFGNLQAKIEIVYGDQPSEKLISETSYYYVNNKAIVIIILLIAGLLIFGTVNKTRKKNR